MIFGILLTSGIIPNIFKRGIYKNNIITFNNSDNIILNTNDVIKIIDKNKYNNGNEFNIITIIDKNNFIIEKELTSEDIFIIGTKINDFKSVDYNMITTLNTKAIQELYEIIQAQQEQINFLLSKVQ
jgi:hypothetical protein